LNQLLPAPRSSRYSTRRTDPPVNPSPSRNRFAPSIFLYASRLPGELAGSRLRPRRQWPSSTAVDAAWSRAFRSRRCSTRRGVDACRASAYFVAGGCGAVGWSERPRSAARREAARETCTSTERRGRPLTPRISIRSGVVRRPGGGGARWKNRRLNFIFRRSGQVRGVFICSTIGRARPTAVRLCDGGRPH